MLKLVPIVTSCLFLAAMSSSVTPQTVPPDKQIMDLTAGSECLTKEWPGRGLAPKAYIRGIALVFARAVCNPMRADVKIVSEAKASDGEKSDALTWYDAQFSHLNMRNDTAGLDTLRHTYVLLIGLGMRESSGRHCIGRDRSAHFTKADTAEAGLLQTSWGAHTKTGNGQSVLESMFASYSGASAPKCYLDIFSRHVSCGAKDAENFGTGEGAAWQKLAKACPAFSAEYGAVIMRRHGGGKGEFGPIRRRQAELRKSCDSMLLSVQQLIAANPKFCDELK